MRTAKEVRQRVWFTPLGPLCPFRAAVVWKWGPFKRVLYRDRLAGRCYTEAAWFSDDVLWPRDRERRAIPSGRGAG